MRPSQAQDLFRSLASTRPDVQAEVGQDDYVAFVRLAREDDDDRWVELSTPGITWYSMRTDGGYELAEVDEEASDSEVTSYVTRHFELAMAYLEGSFEYKPARWPWNNFLVIHAADEVVRVNLSIDRLIRRLLRRPG